ncbi:MAG: M23 family metallopeptidase [bacterium]
MRVFWFSLGFLLLSLSLAKTWGQDAAHQWDLLQALVRDNKISHQEARERLLELHGQLTLLFREKDKDKKMAFPIKGGSWRDLGGRGGSGFVARGYDFFQGNRHGGHPAHDIFILDRDQDSLEDRSGKPVEVLAFLSGVVVGLNRDWKPGSNIRGGNYVWVFTPWRELYCYYAHLQEVLVEVGQWVEAGQTLGTLGRSGKNAFPSRSPTHLHFMCLFFDDGRMSPYNPYQELLSLGGK